MTTPNRPAPITLDDLLCRMHSIRPDLHIKLIRHTRREYHMDIIPVRNPPYEGPTIRKTVPFQEIMSFLDFLEVGAYDAKYWGILAKSHEID